MRRGRGQVEHGIHPQRWHSVEACGNWQQNRAGVGSDVNAPFCLTTCIKDPTVTPSVSSPHTLEC